MEWLEGENVLKISDISVNDAGVYTCVAYTPEPKKSEDQASATVNIKGLFLSMHRSILSFNFPPTPVNSLLLPPPRPSILTSE